MAGQARLRGSLSRQSNQNRKTCHLPLDLWTGSVQLHQSATAFSISSCSCSKLTSPSIEGGCDLRSPSLTSPPVIVACVAARGREMVARVSRFSWSPNSGRWDHFCLPSSGEHLNYRPKPKPACSLSHLMSQTTTDFGHQNESPNDWSFKWHAMESSLTCASLNSWLAQQKYPTCPLNTSTWTLNSSSNPADSLSAAEVFSIWRRVSEYSPYHSHLSSRVWAGSPVNNVAKHYSQMSFSGPLITSAADNLFTLLTYHHRKKILIWWHHHDQMMSFPIRDYSCSWRYCAGFYIFLQL